MWKFICYIFDEEIVILWQIFLVTFSFPPTTKLLSEPALSTSHWSDSENCLIWFGWKRGSFFPCCCPTLRDSRVVIRVLKRLVRNPSSHSNFLLWHIQTGEMDSSTKSCNGGRSTWPHHSQVGLMMATKVFFSCSWYLFAILERQFMNEVWNRC